MDRSPAFASDTRNLSRTLRTRFRFGFEPEALNLAAHINSPVHYAKGTRSLRSCEHGAPTACRYMVSDSFDSPPGVLFTFHSRYWFAIGHQGVFSLGGWAPQIHARFNVAGITRVRGPREP